MILTLTAWENPLQATYFPPLELQGECELGLLSVRARNLTPNVTMLNNLLSCAAGNTIELAPGYYSIGQISKTLDANLKAKWAHVLENESHQKQMGNKLIEIHWNPTISRVELQCFMPVEVTCVRNICASLGFEAGQTLEAYRRHRAENAPRFYECNLVRVNCPGVRGCYYNGVRSQTLHEFDCVTAPGEPFEERPPIVTYHPVCERQSLREVRVEICNEQNIPWNTSNTLIVVRLHLRAKNASGI